MSAAAAAVSADSPLGLFLKGDMLLKALRILAVREDHLTLLAGVLLAAAAAAPAVPTPAPSGAAASPAAALPSFGTLAVGTGLRAAIVLRWNNPI
jgi:hypothetical protein